MKIPDFKGEKQKETTKKRVYKLPPTTGRKRKMKRMSMPIKALNIRFIDGKVIKKQKNKVKKGKAKGRGKMMFNLEETVFEEKLDLLKKKFVKPKTPLIPKKSMMKIQEIPEFVKKTPEPTEEVKEDPK